MHAVKISSEETNSIDLVQIAITFFQSRVGSGLPIEMK